MFIDIDWLGIVLAVVAHMVVGMVWYARPVFGTIWMRLVGISPDTIKKESMVKAMIVSIAMAFISAFVLERILITFGDAISEALQTVSWLWLGFFAAPLLVHLTYEGKDVKLWLLYAVHELVTVLAMATIILLV